MAILGFHFIIKLDGLGILVQMLIVLAQEHFPREWILTLLSAGLDTSFGIVRALGKDDIDGVRLGIIILVEPIKPGVNGLGLFAKSLICLHQETVHLCIIGIIPPTLFKYFHSILILLALNHIAGKTHHRSLISFVLFQHCTVDSIGSSIIIEII